MVRRAAVLGLVLASTAATASADLLQLKDGRVVEGPKMEKKDDSILLLYRNGTVRVPLSMVEDFSIEGYESPVEESEEAKAKRAEGLVPFQGKWVRPEFREREVRKEAEARRKALEEAKKHEEWRDRYRFKTRNFEFESTAPEARNEEFSELLETYFKEFGKVWRVSVPRDWGRLRVCIYAKRDDYLRTSGGPRNSLAYYRFVDPRELNFYYDAGDPEMSISCLFHEANHYLTDLMEESFQYPHWVNEAMAEYYGASRWDPDRKSMTTGGIQQGRLVEIRSDMTEEKYLSLRDLVASTSDSYAHYYWGWSFVHFMMETPKYRSSFMRFFADLARARDVERRPHRSFSGVKEVQDGNEILRAFLSRMKLREEDLPALQKEWYAHIDAMEGSALRGLEEGGLRAYTQGRTAFRAPRLLKAAVDKGSRNMRVWIRYAQCLCWNEKPTGREEALKVLEKAAEVDPLDPDVRAYQGYVLTLLDRPEEAKRALDLAREMNPGEDYLEIRIQLKLGGMKDAGD